MSSEKMKSIANTMANFYKRHKTELLSGMQALHDEQVQYLLKQKILQESIERAFKTYKDKVLYEQALDYASK